ncbi:defensin-like protein CAL1 [Panicum virgatum]|uniref:Knottins-like domain-containing protein n=1 Tax=Panicum virgatum TaxID=38727 RepID=A0A8T0WZW7_PANVG|nr:defensin-like protein CAL1 [Panicum virgatum]XP_039787572.1 defensin-like protein CAL1 [Panicum virgatum]KAG2650403.1 hypothetical protein PVAP13_1NG200619 [Panicum virgatum]KAG2650513.1 hypothetical protein PVAP13_1NG200400 [Panicum virgatum]
MALSRRMAAPVLFVVVLLVVAATETVTARVVADETHCLSQSHTFKGMCFSSENCASVCKSENFPSGECKMHGATRKCFCKVVC